MSVVVLYNPEIANYDFGAGHSFRGDRFGAFLRVYQERLGEDSGFRLITHHESATDEMLRYWHTQDYINVVRAASQGSDSEGDELDTWSLIRGAGVELGPKRGPSRQSVSVYVSSDNICSYTGRVPVGIESAARAIVRNSMMAVDYAMRGEGKAVGIGGGLHHAKASYGEGFCFYNDVVIAAKYAMQQYGLERVLILDTDAHAGNGTCEAFYRDPRVLFIDLHEVGIYPGTGSVDEVGDGAGEGFTVNVPLPMGAGDGLYKRVFDEVVFPLAREYRPELIIRNGGSDPHFQDRLANLGMSLAGFGMIGDQVRRLSDELCGGRCVDLIGSGYNPEVLPRAWVSLIAGLNGRVIEFAELVPEVDRLRMPNVESVIGPVRLALGRYWRSLA